MLSDFEIRSDTIRFPVGQAKGYHRPDFADAWVRYCPPPAGVPVPSVRILVFPGHPLVRIQPWYGLIRTNTPTRGTDQSVPPINPYRT